MDLKETVCEDGRWLELAQDRVQWRALELAVWNLRVLLPESQFCFWEVVWYCYIITWSRGRSRREGGVRTGQCT
jgi:hypothetical protein